jgi:hypothetical protein
MAAGNKYVRFVDEQASLWANERTCDPVTEFM